MELWIIDQRPSVSARRLITIAFIIAPVMGKNGSLRTNVSNVKMRIKRWISQRINTHDGSNNFDRNLILEQISSCFNTAEDFQSQVMSFECVQMDAKHFGA